MSANNKELVNIAVELSKSEYLKVTVVESCKGACIAGGSTLIGGLLKGPLGLALGGIIGVMCASLNGRGEFKSVASVIVEMSSKKSKSSKSCIQIHTIRDGVLLLKLV